MDQPLSIADPGVRSGSPCLQGHFPGNPIVPGAVLLGRASVALAEAGYRIASIRRLKFARPLLPDTAFEITLAISDARARVVWKTTDTVLAEASLTVAPVHG